MSFFESFGKSDLGRRRDINEDSLFFDDQLGLYIVADGMGGQNAGEVASSMTVDVVSRFIRRSLDSDGLTWPFGIIPNLSLNGNRIRTAVMMANRRVWKHADSQPESLGMGTTIVTALTDESVLTICSAGDSRAYRIRDNTLKQITTDDSWIQAAVRAGAVISETVHDHPMRNIVTKAVGAKETIDIEILEVTAQKGDLYLLCSDGLHGALLDTKILEIVLSAQGDIRRAVSDLIAAANAADGRDNITVLIIRVGSS